MWRDPSSPKRRRDPRNRDVVRRDRRGRRHGRRRGLLERRRLAGRAARALRRGRAGGRLAPSSRARRARWCARRSTQAGVALDDVERVAVTKAPGSSARSWSGSPPPRRSPGRGACRSSRSITCTGTSRRSTSSPTRSSRRSSACSRAAGTRCCSTSEPGPVPRPRHDARRRRRRGVRQGSATARPRLSGRRGDRPAARGRRPERVTPFRSRASRARLLLLGLKTALLYAGRDLAARSQRRQAELDLAASYQRAIVGRCRAERTRSGRGEPDGSSGSPSSVASRRTRSSAPLLRPTPPSRRSTSAPTTRR